MLINMTFEWHKLSFHQDQAEVAAAEERLKEFQKHQEERYIWLSIL